MSFDPEEHEAERRRSLESYEPKPKALRASDADRDRAVAQLRQHLSDGRLTVEEFSERLDQAYAARTTADLDHALRELPYVQPTDDHAAVAERAKQRRNELRDLRANLVSYLLVNTFLVLVWLVTTPGGYFWPIWPLLGWGLGVALHAYKTLGERE